MFKVINYISSVGRDRLEEFIITVALQDEIPPPATARVVIQRVVPRPGSWDVAIVQVVVVVVVVVVVIANVGVMLEGVGAGGCGVWWSAVR